MSGSYGDNPLTAGSPTLADAWSYNANALTDWLNTQRAKSAAMGLWNDRTGLPTAAGLVNAAGQYGNALMMGTSTPEAAGFDTATTWLHGTAGDHPTLDVDHAGRVSSGDAPGLWFTKDPQYASEYAQNAATAMEGEPRIIEAHLRADNPLTVRFSDAPDNPEIDGKPTVNGKVMDFENNADIMAYAKRHGHDVVFMPDGNFSEATAAAAVLKNGRVWQK
jgi:hypothetical protein